MDLLAQLAINGLVNGSHYALLALGFGLIWSLSYELFDAHCPEDWKQRAADGSPALTGWAPPSTLLLTSPAIARFWSPWC